MLTFFHWHVEIFLPESHTSNQNALFMPQYIYGPHLIWTACIIQNTWVVRAVSNLKYLSSQTSQPAKTLCAVHRSPVGGSTTPSLSFTRRRSFKEMMMMWEAFSCPFYHIMKLMTHWCVLRFKSHSNITLLWMYRECGSVWTRTRS